MIGTPKVQRLSQQGSGRLRIQVPPAYAGHHYKHVQLWRLRGCRLCHNHGLVKTPEGHHTLCKCARLIVSMQEATA